MRASLLQRPYRLNRVWTQAVPNVSPVVTSVTPNTGVAAGGTVITDLAGTGFQNGATVNFGGVGGVDGVAATGVVFVSPTKLTCVTPAGLDSGLITASVVAAAGTYTRSAGSYLTNGFKVGQVISWTGFLNAGNNAVKTILNLTATVMTVGVAGLVDEAGTGDENVMLNLTAVVVTNPDTTTSGASGFGSFTYVPFDPALLNFARWVRADWTAIPLPAAPPNYYGGTNSAGTSGTFGGNPGGNRFHDSGPVQGNAAPVDGFLPLEVLNVAGGGCIADATEPTSGFTYSLLCKPKNPAAPTPGGPQNGDPNVYGYGPFGGVCWSTSGVIFFIFSGGVFPNTGWVACAANAWHQVDVRCTGALIEMRVDKGAWSQAVAGVIGAGPFNSYLGWNNAASGQIDCDYLEVITSNTLLSDADLNGLNSYYKTRYPSAGLP